MEKLHQSRDNNSQTANRQLESSKNASRVGKDKSSRLIVVVDKARLRAPSQKFRISKEDELNIQLVHQCLLMLFDSPLNHAGLLQVMVRTVDNQLIYVHRETRIPRTLKRFTHLLTSLLVDHNLPNVPTKDGSIQLMRLLNGPLERHLPAHAKTFKIINRLSTDPTKIQDLTREFEPTSNQLPRPAIIYVDANEVDMNPNNNDDDETEARSPKRSLNNKGDGKEQINGTTNGEATGQVQNCALSLYPMSPAMVCARVVSAFESRWGIL